MILLIDHYDSFIDMIGDYIKKLGYTYSLVKTDSPQLDTINLTDYTHIIIGPGPGHPQDKSLAKVYSVISQAIEYNLPILGICLGHQIIGSYFGGEIITADFIAHGIVDKITVTNQSIIFNHLPTTFKVTRYHSLLINCSNLPTNLKITAITQKNEIMAIENTKYKIYGVQFHPESIMTEYGSNLLANFLRC